MNGQDGKRQQPDLRRHGSMIRLARAVRCTRGTALIEMAIVTPMLLMLFASIFEFGRLFHTRLTARHAVIEATRYAVTGNQLTDPDTGIGICISFKRRFRNSGKCFYLFQYEWDCPGWE